MIEVTDKIVSSPKSVGFVADNLCFVIEPFNGTVIYGHVEPCENVCFVAPHHPGKVTHGFKAGMCCPPKPLFQMFFGPGFRFV